MSQFGVSVIEEGPPRDRWSGAWAAACAAVALGTAIQIRNGLFEPYAFIWLTAGILTCAAVFFAAPDRSIERLGRRGFRSLLAAALAAEFIQLFLSRPGSFSKHGAVATPLFYTLLTLAAASVAALWLFPRYWQALLSLVVVFFLALGVSTIRSTPSPHIDTWFAQTQGLSAFAHGNNPYRSTFPDIYHNPAAYAPGTVKNGQVDLGFPYPPLTLLFDLPGYLLGGDYRYSNLAAMAAAALLIAAARPGRLAALAAALCLFTPRVFLVVERGWTEPQITLMLAALIFARCRYPKAVPWLLGLLLVSKQYMFLAAGPALLLLDWPLRPRQVARTAAIAAAVALAVSLPLALWDVRAFLHSTLLVSGGTPFRSDALSYLGIFGVAGHVPSAWLATAIGFAAAALGTIIALRRAPRTPAGFAAGIAFVFLLCFAFNKFAFCNYYYFIISALCCAAAAARPAPALAVDLPVQRADALAAELAR